VKSLAFTSWKERISLHIVGSSLFYHLCHVSQGVCGGAFHRILFSEMLLLKTTVLLVTLGTFSCDYIDS